MADPLDLDGLAPSFQEALDRLPERRIPGVDRIATEGARLQVGGRVPSLARMAEMSDAELSLLAKRFGIDPERVAMTEQAIERATSRLIGADAPDPALVERVMKQAESAVRRELQQAAKRLVRQYTTEKLDVGPDTPMLWQAVDEGACPSCKERDGKTMTQREWEEIGEPGSPNTLCNGSCRCSLLPQEMFDA